MATGRRPPLSDIPDLEVPQVPSRRFPAESAPVFDRSSQRPAVPKPESEKDAPSKSPLDYFGSGTFDADHFGDGDTSLALDDSSGGAHTAYDGDALAQTSGTPGFADDFDLLEGSDAAAVQSIQAVSRRPERPWPTGSTFGADVMDVDALMVRDIAGVGDPPDNPLLSAVYSSRVLSRRRSLARRIDTLTAALENLERTRDETLGDIVRANRQELEQDDATRPFFKAVRSAESAVAEQQRALAGTNAEYDGAARQLTEKLGQLDDELRRHDRICEAHGAELTQQRNELQRITSLTDRLYAELKPLAPSLEKSPNSLTAAQTKRAADIGRQLASLQPQVTSGEKRAQDLEGRLASAKRARAEVERERRDVFRHQKALADRFAPQLGDRTAKLASAENDLRTRLADVMRQVLSLRGKVPVDDHTLDELLLLDQEVADAARELETHRRAAEFFDPLVYRRGLWVGAALALVVLGLLLFLIVGPSD